MQARVRHAVVATRERLAGRGAIGEDAERVRTRVRLLVELTTRAGRYRRGLVQATLGLTPEEATVLSDLEAHGLDVNQLRDVLCGGHVLVDDPALYERWRFPRVSRERLSSHHRQVDKTMYPDIGMRGPLVREKLHGRTATGTWVQLEKTPAAFGGGGFHLPTWNDVEHLVDYVVYRATRRNVGPWGLSGVTERRPMYLSPRLAASVGMADRASALLAATLARIDAEDAAGVAHARPELARRVPGPVRPDPLEELRPRPGRDRRGLFGNSQVWVTDGAGASARRLIGAAASDQRWDLPPAGTTRPVEVTVHGRRLRLAARVPATDTDTDTAAGEPS